MASPGALLKESLRRWRGLPPLVRDVVGLVVTFVVVLGGLYLYTGVWPPAVIVESGSMMHPAGDVPFGRWGTIDPGDLILVKKVQTKEDVGLYTLGGETHFGKPGDVIIYYKGGRRETTPIIHRAMTWVDVRKEGGSTYYDVVWGIGPCPEGSNRVGPTMCRFGSGGITIPEIGAEGFIPSTSGFLTKGDNPFTNPRLDQQSGLADVVQLSWIEGKAGGEVPWLGLVKLALSPQYNERFCANSPLHFMIWESSRSPQCAGWVGVGHAFAPKDLWIMLFVSLALILGGPMVYDHYKGRKGSPTSSLRPSPEERDPPRT